MANVKSMGIKTRRTILIGIGLIGSFGILVWFFYLGPILIVPRIHNHDQKAVEWFCRLGVSPNRDAWLIGGVFHCAVASGDSNIVVMMLKRGADIDRIAGYGYTPLQVATRHDQVPMMKLLVGYGADPFRLSREGETALELATKEKLEGPKVYLEELAKMAKLTN